jgi:hypothetical protein
MVSQENTGDEVEFDVLGHLRKGVFHAHQRAAVDDAAGLIS